MTAAVASNGLSGNGGPDQKSMLSYFDRIDTLTTHPESEAEFSREVTRKHWKPADGISRCSNRTCRKQFSLLERPHHCRKCGEVFCASCLQFQRKLNQLAHFDPLQGRSYKVCKTCYEEGTTADGCMRNLTSEFAQLRQQGRNHKSTGSTGGEITAGEGRRNQVNFDLECQRLLDGFKHSMGGKSEFRRTLHEMRNMVTMPNWHKSSIWLTESIGEACRICCKTFGLLRKRHHCKVCGLALCKSCSTLDLLVYVPNSEVHSETGLVPNASDLEACIAIIKIVGCPEVEPEMSMYLRVCRACREAVIQRQLKQLNSDEAPSGLEMLEELSALHSRFSVAELNVNSQLRDYQDIVESLENNTRSSMHISSSASTISGKGEGGGTGKGGPKGGATPPQRNMRTLAKAQEDLNDFLAQHVLVVQRLKRLAPRSEPQSRLLKNYIRAKCDYYLENMSTFRRLKKKFEESSPPEVLEFIQRIMDKDAIISAHLYLRQLVYESIHLCDKYELQEKSPQLLVTLEQVIEMEVTECLQREGEDVGQHMELMKEMIRTQMKDHKLIRPSRQTVSRHGRTHVQHIMSVRIREVLDQVTLQLKFKSANRSFSTTKQALGKTTELLAAA